jgi:hypothetical protein
MIGEIDMGDLGVFRLTNAQIRYITGQKSLKNDQKRAKNGQKVLKITDFSRK